jgi:hypothetical protein
MTATLPDEEECSGSRLPGTAGRGTVATTNLKPSADLQAIWEDVYGYGPKFYLTHIAKSRSRMQVTLHCEGGTTLILELWHPGMLQATFDYGTDTIGVAKDTKGDTYEVRGPSNAPPD